jgi:hypothetical protein
MVPLKRTWPALGAAVPSVAAAILMMVLAIGSMPAVGAFAPREPLTLAEAAGLHDKAEIVRLIRRGHDPNIPARVRRGVLRSPEYVMTPIEAAIAGRRVDVVGLLTQMGAVIDEHNYPVLWCFALANKDADVIAFVEARQQGNTPRDCTSVATAWTAEP